MAWILRGRKSPGTLPVWRESCKVRINKGKSHDDISSEVVQLSQEHLPARAATRAPLDRKVQLQFDDAVEVIEGICRNISIGGMQISSSSPRPRGSLVRFELELDEGVTVRGLGEVVWMRTESSAGPGDPGMGVKFRFIEQRDRQMILKLVSEHIKERLAQKHPSMASSEPGLDDLANAVRFDPPPPIPSTPLPAIEDAPTRPLDRAEILPETPPVYDEPLEGQPENWALSSQPASAQPQAAGLSPTGTGDVLAHQESTGPDLDDSFLSLNSSQTVPHYDEPLESHGLSSEPGGGAREEGLPKEESFIADRGEEDRGWDDLAQDGFAQDGFAQDGFAQDGFAQDGFAQDDRTQDGFAQDGHAPEEAPWPAEESPDESEARYKAPEFYRPRPARRRELPAIPILGLLLLVGVLLTYLYWDQIIGPATPPAPSPPASASTPQEPEETASIEPGPTDPPTASPTSTDPPAAAPASGAGGGSPSPPGGVPAEPSATSRPPPSSTAAPPPSTAAPPPSTAAPPPAAPRTRPLTRVVNVSWTRLPGGVKIEIEGDGHIPEGSYSYFRLSGAEPREVIKLKGIVRQYEKNQIELTGSPVSRIRLGYHPGPKELHLVLDMLDRSTRITQVRSAGSRLEIILE